MSMLRILILFIFAEISSSADVQTTDSNASAKDVSSPKSSISIVALGPKPQRKYKHVEGMETPVMLLAQPGETPPSRLYYKGKEEGDEKARWLALNVSFNTPPAMQAIPSGKKLSLFQRLPGENDFRHYLTVPAGLENSRRIFFLTPATKGRTPWMQPPRVSTISLNSASYKGKQFILKNLSKFTVLHAFDDNVVSISPTKTISWKQSETDRLLRVAARYGTHKKIIYNTAVRISRDGHITLFALYDANPRTNSGRSVGVFRMMIPAHSPCFE